MRNMLTSSSYTGRAPRSMQAAFGPYTSGHIDEPHQPATFRHAVYAVVLVAAIAAFVIVASGG